MDLCGVYVNTNKKETGKKTAFCCTIPIYLRALNVHVSTHIYS